MTGVPTVKHKTFTYRTSTEWRGRRNASLTAKDKTSIPVSSPPEFKGEPNIWTPEDLFVASVETCYLMTLASLIEKRHLAVEAYYSEAEGVLEFQEGGYQFTKVTIKPTVIVTDRTAAQPVMEALEEAKRACLVSRSINSDVVIEPDVEISATE